MSIGPWFRVPAWIGGRMNGGAPATEEQAWVDLLGRWHQGEDPGIKAMMRAWGWGAGRTTNHIKAVAAWAISNGAFLPERYRNASGTPAERPDPGSKPDSNDERNASGTLPERQRNDSCARVPLREREEKREEIPPTPQGGDGEARVLEVVMVPSPAPAPPPAPPAPAPQEGALVVSTPAPAPPAVQTAPPGQASPVYGPSTHRVCGVDLPADLPNLLFGLRAGRKDVIAALVGGGIDSTAALLALSVEELRYCPGIGPAIANAIAAHLLRERGVEMPAAKRRHVSVDDVAAQGVPIAAPAPGTPLGLDLGGFFKKPAPTPASTPTPNGAQP